ncbi:MAG: FkbM family methyltransferase [Cyclobacteriaceae bacterium]
MNPKVSKFFRSIQVYFPALQDYRFSFERTMRRILNKTHEKDFEALHLLPKSENKLFLDIGANRGAATQSILMRVPDAKVIAFEPNPFLTEKLLKLYSADNRVTVQTCGLGSETDTIKLFIPFYNNYMFDGLASFKEENARDWLENRLYGFRKEKLEVKGVISPVKPLDDFNVRPYFIKMDVQGFEYEVLLGAKKTLTESKPIILIETPDDNVIEFLSSLHYKFCIFREGQLVEGKDSANVFFIPNEMDLKIGKIS